MKYVFLLLLSVAAVISFGLAIVLNNLILFATSIAFALAAYLSDKRYREYFDMTELKNR